MCAPEIKDAILKAGFRKWKAFYTSFPQPREHRVMVVFNTPYMDSDFLVEYSESIFVMLG